MQITITISDKDVFLCVRTSGVDGVDQSVGVFAADTVYELSV